MYVYLGLAETLASSNSNCLEHVAHGIYNIMGHFYRKHELTSALTISFTIKLHGWFLVANHLDMD